MMVGIELDSNDVFDFLAPKNQVPEPPIAQSVVELQRELQNAQNVWADTANPFGSTRVQYASRTEYERAKRESRSLIETISSRLQRRQEWETNNRLVQKRLGSTIVFLEAQEVLDRQKFLKAALNKKDKELVAYDKAVKDYRDLSAKLEKSDVPDYEKYYQRLQALANIRAKATDKVRLYRPAELDTTFSPNANLNKKKTFFSPDRAEQQIPVLADFALKAADREIGERVEVRDKYGRLQTYRYVRSDSQAVQLQNLESQISGLVSGERQAAFVSPAGAVGGAPTGVTQGQTASRVTQNPMTSGAASIAPSGAVTQNPVTQTVSNRPATTPASTPAADSTATQPASSAGGGATGEAGGGGAGMTGTGRRRGIRNVSPDQLAEAVQAFFPNYSAEWLSENGVQHFGQDLIDLFRRVAAPGSTFDLSTEAGKERIRAEIRKTVYWQTTLTAAKNFDQLAQVDQVNTLERAKQRLANTYGDLGLDDATLTELARNVARNGLSGLGEQQAVYNTVFRLQQERPAQAQRALEGQQADRIRQLAKAYNYRVTDQQIQSILTGTPEATTGLVLTEDGLRERMQKAVKGAMPQLADQIDAGLTLEDIGSNYRRYAANLLEKSEDQIDMFSGPYLDAFGNKDGGQLSLGEWSQKVKSDPRFGWQFTNQANVLAGDIALTIARAFGKVR